MLTQESAARKDKANAKGTLEHRHFATIAAIIAGVLDDDQRVTMAYIFANNLPDTNPRFDRVRFLRACGVN